MATETTPGIPARWPTPRLLKVHLAAVLVLALLLLLVGEGTLAKARATLRTIGKDTAPSIVAAQEIQMHLADLDAAAATTLVGAAQVEEIEARRAEALKTGAPLGAGAAAGAEYADAASAAAQQLEAAAQLFELRRASVTRRLVDASQNITYGDTEKVPVVAILDGLQRFVGLVTEARARTARGDLRGAREQYRLATDLLHVHMLPAAQALDDANKNEMNTMYVESGRATAGAEAFAVVVGAALILALFLTQAFTNRRFRRLTSPPLLLAMVLAVGFTGYLVQKFGAARADLKIAKEDAFESIHLLTRARALALDAKGDQRRWLFEEGRGPDAAELDTHFRGLVGNLTTQPDFPPAAESAAASADGAKSLPFADLFADEFANAVFRGEREAALDMAREFASFHRADTSLRARAAKGTPADLAAARLIALGEGNNAFELFDASAQRVQLLNEDVFEKILGEADRGLKSAEIWDPGLALAIALLAWLGVRPRLREFQ
jgi:hypothetical protein